MITPENPAGLIVGEGCFYAESAPDAKYRSGWRVRPGFCVEMRSDEREVLEDVQALLGCGNVYDLDFGRYLGYADRDWSPHVKFRVSSVKDLAVHVVPFFSTYPLFGTKRVAFGIFSELVGVLYRRDHRTPAGLETARGLAARLAEHNARGRRGSSQPRSIATDSSP